MRKWIAFALLLAALFVCLNVLVTVSATAGWAAAHTYHETFTTETYQDAAHTTAVWDTLAGQLRLPAPVPRSENVLRQLYYAAAWSPAVYVPDTDLVYLFGGTGRSDAIQEYDPATNTSTKSGLTLPFPLLGSAAVYVESRQAIYLLGGGWQTDVVVFDVGQMITTVLENKLPAPLSYASAVYVPHQDKAYIFGGSAVDGSPLDTILEYDLAAGTVVTLPVSLPTPTTMASAIYDPVTDSAYVFGGQVLDYPTPQILAFDVTEKTITEVGVLPVPCSATAAVYVPPDKAYIFGGMEQIALPLKQIIEFDISSHSVTSLAAELPGERSGAAAVYIPSRAMAYILGGQYGPSTLSDVVAFDVNQHTATDITVRLDGRIGASGVYVPANRKVYLFGGQSGDQAASSHSILAYNVDEVTVNTLPATLPVSRTDTAAVYVPATNQAYVFGGLQPGPTDRYFADILRFDVVAEGVSTASAVLPTGRAGMAAVYVPEKGKAYLFGGVGSSGCLDEILVYDPLQDNLTLLPAKLPEAAAYAAAVYDALTAKVYLFGGWALGEGGYSELYLNQIVAFDIATETATALWERMPQFMKSAAAIAIPGESAVYVIGGAFPGRSLSEIYCFDPVEGVVTLLPDAQLAEGRASEVAVYLPEQVTAYLFGGSGSWAQPLFHIAALRFAYPLSATARSLKVNAPGEEVQEALLTVQQTLRGGSVSYSLSNNGGQTWAGVQPGVKHAFASPGSDLRWRAVLSGNGETTPIVDSLSITYNGIEQYQLFLPVVLKVQRQ
jgi:N-acetylneuraminic acid mutarotase